MGNLKPNVLSFIELLAQNIALISATMTAVLIIPFMFGISGNMSWLSYVLGTLMLLFVAFNLNQFATRTTGTGSMYSYAGAGLGFAGGALCGCCLVWSYLFIGLAGTTGFTIFAGKLLPMIGIAAPPLLLFAACIGASFLIAYFDVKVSTLVMLCAEGASLFFILLLCVIILAQHDPAFSADQFTFKGVTLSSLGMGIVVAVWSLVGFESSTAFGDEAVKPLDAIPRSVNWSLILTGLFFVFVSYVEVQGIQGYKDSLDKVEEPLNLLAELYGVPFLSPVIAAGAMVSFFALALSCMNAGARVMFAMGRDGLFPQSTSRVHPRHRTPQVALAVMALLMFAVAPLSRFAFGWQVREEFDYAGTMGAMGFISAYCLVSLAVPGYLRQRGELAAMHVGMSVAALALLLIPAVGFFVPLPAAPVRYFPYVFAACLAAGLLRARAMQAGRGAGSGSRGGGA